MGRLFLTSTARRRGEIQDFRHSDRRFSRDCRCPSGSCCCCLRWRWWWRERRRWDVTCMPWAGMSGPRGSPAYRLPESSSSLMLRHRCALGWAGDAWRLGVLADGDQGDRYRLGRRDRSVAVAGASEIHAPASPHECRRRRVIRQAVRWLLIAAVATAVALGGCRRDRVARPLIVVLVPSQDNPFFKAEADAAAARAQSLG